MASRNLTGKFEFLRSQIRRSSPSIGLGPLSAANDSKSANTKARLLDKSFADRSDDIELGPDPGSSSQLSLPPELPPEWVDIVDEIHKDIAKIKANLKSLENLHGLRLKVTFENEVVNEQEREIELLTQTITRLLRKSENNVKRIAAVGNNGKLPQQERTVRLNVMRSLAAELQTQSKAFRHAQKDFLKRLRELEQTSSSFGFEDSMDSKTSLTFDDALDRGWTPEQAQQMQEIEQRASEREKEIIRIAQSVNELASLFKELNVLVIEQGTILDRIDYNIEQSLNQVKKGTAELVEADNWSKKAYTMKCIFLMGLIIVILIVILIIKKQ